MKVVYLKNKTNVGYQHYAKATSDGILEVDGESIKRIEIDDSLEEDVEWLKLSYNMAITTKEKFDDFLSKTEKYIQELKSI